jgi:alkanesulfonate monooxygenase SsuD/methylene tetrahydromethanopterin reductase-like flavin-dependent oxidoreductase (luciferase family)
MRVCLMIEGQEGVEWEHWLALAHACERSGLEGLFRSDHYLSGFAPDELGTLDAWATLAALAARTARIRLGTLVSPVTFRHPAVLAKNALTVDHVSGGRVEVGLGAGWNETEHEAFGFDFPDVGTRMTMLEEQLEVVTRQWGEMRPQPVQQPRPPLIVGGAAGPRSLDLAVRFADEYNTTFASPAECAERRARLDRSCERRGREPGTIAFSLMTFGFVGADASDVESRRRRIADRLGRSPEEVPRRKESALAGTVDEVAARLSEYEAAGVERVMLQHLDHEDVAMVDLLGAELAPAVA